MHSYATVPRVCERCGAEFFVTPSALRQSPCTFCSRACAASTRRTRVARTCRRCGRSFEVRAYKVLEGKGLFCSRFCANSLLSLPLADHFWSFVEKTEQCWLWRSTSDVEGYGKLYLPRAAGEPRREARATHVAWELASGSPVPADRHILHICDTPACVRNDDAGVYRIDGEDLPRYGHLVLGTNTQNSRDRTLKGRDRYGPAGFLGEANVSASLTREEVLAIRARAAHGERVGVLARAYDLSHQQVSKIVARQRWAWLDEETAHAALPSPGPKPINP